MQTRQVKLGFVGVLALLLVAFTTFANPLASAPTPASAELRAYLLAGGSLADLCAEPGAEDHRCPLCREVEPLALASVFVHIFPACLPHAINADRVGVLAAFSGGFSAQPRAPPALV